MFVIARPVERGAGYVAYIRTSWTRGFRPLRTFHDKGDRVYRDLDLLVGLIRTKFAYHGEISIFEASDEALQRFRLLLPTDRESLAHDPGKHVGDDDDQAQSPEADPP